MTDAFEGRIDIETAQKQSIAKRDSRPEEGDTLFKPDKDSCNNARLNILSDNRGLYVEGYKRAADILEEHVKSTHSDQDILVYPLVFLYRHHLELRLKAIIRDGARFLGDADSLGNTHDIVKLWQYFREILIKIWGEKTENLDVIEDYIKQFSKVDFKSEAFRYPEDKKGNTTLPGQSLINLRHLSEVVGKIADFLEYVNKDFSERLSQKHEFDSEY